MFLKSIEYSQFEGSPRLWRLKDCTLGNTNLIVGRNATGKSRTLSIINGLANLLSGQFKLKWLSGKYVVEFENKKKPVKYILHFENACIIKEELYVSGINRLKRKKDGSGSIYYKEVGRFLNFRIAPNELAAIAKRDTIQHPFLEDLYSWGEHASYYEFKTIQLGKTTLSGAEGVTPQALNVKDTSQVVNTFIEGREKYSGKFTRKIVDDMNNIGYSLKEIGIQAIESILLPKNISIKPFGLYVKESDLSGSTEQVDMSDGMFRALSLIIQIHYSLLTSKPSCILIDDIGEGLDFQRSSALVKLLIERAKKLKIQLIMATNDRFIINSVPLEHLLVIQRIGGISKIHNQENSSKLFDDFELTGLNNFDFFSSGYYLKENPQD